MSDKKNIWIYSEQKDGKIEKVAFELIGKARELKKSLESEISALLCCGSNIKNIDDLFSAGADNIILINDDIFQHYRPDMHPHVVAQLTREYRPEILLVGATATGRDLAPAVAARLNTGCAADCCDLSLDEDGNLQQSVPAFGGKFMANIITPLHRPQITTVRPGVFKKPEKQTKKGRIIQPFIEFPQEQVELLGVKFEQEPSHRDITEAKTIVAGGAGIKDEWGWELIKQLAEKLQGVTGGTRPALDEKRITARQMIGQSGYNVRPELYIAVGISGDIQHMIGARDSRIVVAINSDPGARIFKHADYGIVGDYREILPRLLEELEKQ